MGLIKCCECGENVSEYAEKCPKCGCPISIIKQKENEDKFVMIAPSGEKIDLTGFEDIISESDLQNTRLVLTTLMDDFDVSFGFAYNIQKMFEFNDYKFPENYQQLYDDMCTHVREELDRKNTSSNKKTSIPKCPTCGSTNISKISATSKAVSVGLWGIFSQKVKKQFKCKNCGYEW